MALLVCLISLGGTRARTARARAARGKNKNMIRDLVRTAVIKLEGFLYDKTAKI
jgi:hypothetical protein